MSEQDKNYEDEDGYNSVLDNGIEIKISYKPGETFESGIAVDISSKPEIPSHILFNMLIMTLGSVGFSIGGAVDKKTFAVGFLSALKDMPWPPPTPNADKDKIVH